MIHPTAIQRVAIVGGTHGNELIGAYLAQWLLQHPHQAQRDSIETLTLLGNPNAFAAGRRYIDKDLNRCFLPQLLQDPTLTSYEDQQAKAIYQQLFPGDRPSVDLIIDLHSSTANMGLTIIPASAHPFNWGLAAHLCHLYPDLKIYRWAESQVGSPFLRSLSPLGFAIEVGPVAQGILDARLFQQTQALVDAMLTYIDGYNRGQSFPQAADITLYQGIELVDYPRTGDGRLTAMIHPQLQFRDYEPLHPGDPLFLTLDGQTLFYQGTETCYPVFINEAAYYEKGIAFCLTEQQRWDVTAPSLI